MAPIREWYGGYSIIYRWFEKKFGEDALYEYWHFVAKEVYSDLAKQFQIAGTPVAFEQVMAAVSDFEKGNMRLSVVLNSLNAE